MKLATGLLGVLLLSAVPASAATMVWTDWTTANSNSAVGTLGGVNVRFTGAINPTAQTSGGTNFWAVNSGIYTPTGVENPPPDSDIIRLTGGTNAGTQTLFFDTPVTNPFMAIMSLGQPSVQVLYEFDAPFDIVNQGVGFWGGSASALSELTGNVLSGNEGHGLIQFSGTFSSISWTIPNAEFWHGFQVGVMAPVPLPATAAVMVLGLGGLAAVRRRKSRC